MIRARSLPLLALPLAYGLFMIDALPARASRQSVERRVRPLSVFRYGEPAATAQQVGSGADAAEGRAATVRRLQRAYDDALSELEKDRAGSATQTLQKKIVEDLDRLINQPPQPQNPAGKSAPHQQQPPDASASRDATPQPSSRAKPGTAGGAPAPRAQVGPPSSTKSTPAEVTGAAAAKSTGPPPGAQTWDPRLPGRQRLSADAFAHDHCLPQYEELLRRYYQAIAEGYKSAR